ncbi:MAG: Membrane-associated zinc metalloprotease, partial [uncultured Campylobacterales bacterium]
ALGILQPKDKIIAVNNIEVKTTAEVINFDKTKTLLYTVLRDGEVLNIELKPKEMIVKNIFGEDETKLLVGIRFDANASFNENASFSQALVESYKSTVFACTLVIKSLQKLIIGAVSPTNLSGIVGMGYVSDKLYQTSFLSFLILMALISANLGIINLLPIPALDGGHIVFNLYEMIFRKEVTLLAVKILTFIGWFILFTLLFFTLYNDIYKIFTNTMIP